MSSVIGGSFVKEGKSSLELDADDLFDKIINLKFIRKSGRSFSIRSDYEPVHHKDGTTSFKRCTQKPDIKIEYKQVAESVAIEVDIHVTNLFIGDGDKESTESMNTVMGDPVQWCVIQMGYRAQFPDWTAPERKKNISQFYDLNNYAISSDAEVQRGNQILVQILTGYPESYPPDKVTYFKGIIGSMETGLRWNHTKDDLVKGYGDPEFPANFSEIEEVLFQFVTRRFIKPSVLHIAETKRDFTNQEALDDMVEKRFEQRIMIYRYDDYEDHGSNAMSRLQSSVAHITENSDNISNNWTELPLLDSGIMSIRGANKFGVICAVSRTLRSMPANALYGYGLTPEQAQALRPIPSTPFNEMHDTIGAQLVSLQQHYPFLRWYELMDGSFYFYHEQDTDKDLWNDPFIKDLQKDNAVFLPAVYDMTPSGTRTIRCPFISFLSPMMTVLFQSRYTIGTMISYFYPPQTNAFLVIIANVLFATVQDDNLMELMCVDLPPQEITVDPKTGQIKVRKNDPPDDESSDVVLLQQYRNMQWIEKQLTVVLHRSGALDTDSRWENIVHNDVLTSVQLDRWPEGTEPTEKMALEALREWNPEYFDPNGQYMARSDITHGESIENRSDRIGGRTGIKVPWLLVGDKITVRHPFQSEYPEDEKVAV